MAIDFAHVTIVSAGSGSAVGLSAYVDRASYANEVTGERYVFTHKAGDVVHTEMMLPADAPAGFTNAEAAWNAAERAELVKDGSRFKQNAQFAKHEILALPKELSEAQRIDLARSWAQERYVSHGVAVQVTVHEAAKGEVNHHAHLIISTRTVDADGFGPKARELNGKFYNGKRLEEEATKVEWARFQNAYFEEKGLDLRVDPSAPSPGRHLGAAAHIDGSELAAQNAAAHAETVAAVRENPEIVLDKITEKSAVFTRQDVARAVSKWTDTPTQFQEAMAKIDASPRLVQLTVADGDAPAKFTTREMVDLEAGAVARARDMSDREGHYVAPAIVEKAIADFQAVKGYTLTPEQVRAVHHLTSGKDWTAVSGIAGTGKSTILSVARDAWEKGGYEVQGVALTGRVADQLSADTGIKSYTMEKLESRLAQADDARAFLETGALTVEARGRLDSYARWATEAAENSGYRAAAEQVHREIAAHGAPVTDAARDFAEKWARRQIDAAPEISSRTVLVCDEAGMIGTRQGDAVASRLQEAGAQFAPVGSWNQAQSIEAGAWFRTTSTRAGYVTLTEVRRQNLDAADANPKWMREAVVEMEGGDMAAGVKAYADRGYVRAGIGTSDEAIIAQISRQAGPLDPEQQAAALRVARYAEARQVAGAEWAAIRARPEASREAFDAWQARRNEAAAEIGRDLGAHREWIERMGVSGRGLAADIAVAEGATRQQAEGQATEAARALGLDGRRVPKVDRIAVDYRAGAKGEMVKGWAEDRGLMLAYRNADTYDLNQGARAIARERGELAGPDVSVRTAKGDRDFAVGDRVVTLRNTAAATIIIPTRDGGTVSVRNGTRWDVERITQAEGAAAAITLREVRDDAQAPRLVEIDTAKYRDLDHGYAVTIHKSQGATLGGTHVLPAGDRYLDTVAMTRHRETCRVYGATVDGASVQSLTATMSQTGSHQYSSLDFGEGRGVSREDVEAAEAQRAADLAAIRADTEARTTVQEYREARTEAGRLYHEISGGRFDAAGRRAAAHHERYGDYTAARDLRDELAERIDAERERYAPHLDKAGITPAKFDADLKSARDGVRVPMEDLQHGRFADRFAAGVGPDPAVTADPSVTGREFDASGVGAGTPAAHLSDVPDLRGGPLARDADRGEMFLPDDARHRMEHVESDGSDALRRAGADRGAESGRELDRRPVASAQPPASAVPSPADLVDRFRDADRVWSAKVDEMMAGKADLAAVNADRDAVIHAARAVVRDEEALAQAREEGLGYKVETVSAFEPDRGAEEMHKKNVLLDRPKSAVVGPKGGELEDDSAGLMGKMVDGLKAVASPPAAAVDTAMGSTETVAALRQALADQDAAADRIGLDPGAEHRASAALDRACGLAVTIAEDAEAMAEARAEGLGERVEILRDMAEERGIGAEDEIEDQAEQAEEEAGQADEDTADQAEDEIEDQAEDGLGLDL